MIASPSRKFIFVHIPKTAGTSVATVLGRVLDPVTDVHFTHGNWHPENLAAAGLDPAVKLGKHATTPQIIRAMGKDAYADHFSFAFCRNPFSRAFSSYKFIRQKARNIATGLTRGGKPIRPLPPNQPDISMFLDMSFDDLCASLADIQGKLGLFKPQIRWLPKVDSVNMVGRLETLKSDMAVILKTIGVEAGGTTRIPHRNRHTEPDAWRNISTQAAQAIRSFYAADFERFEYSTDLDARNEHDMMHKMSG